MPFNGTGTFQPIPPPDYPAVPGTTISSTHYNNFTADLMSGLSNCVTRDGQSPATANLPMGGFKHTNVAAAAANNEYATLGQLNSAISGLGSSGSYKNKIINGDFNIWQRGTMQASSGYGSCDRWLNGSVGSTKVTSRQAFAIGQTSVPGNPVYYCSTFVSSAPGMNTYVNQEQRIEDVRILAGQVVTVGVWAKADAPKSMSLELEQIFGTGGPASPTVTAIGVTKLNLTTAWTYYTVQISVPSIAGKTLGTNNDSYTSLIFWYDAGSDFNARTDTLGHQSGTFDISQVQVELGSSPTPFEAIQIGQELDLCLRYYEKSYSVGVNPGATSNLGASVYRYITGVELTNTRFNVEKRSPPVIIYYSTATGTSGMVRNFTASTNVSASATKVGSTGFSTLLGANQSNGDFIEWQWAADAEL